ncbi:MAG: hypothetical protein GTO24_06490 [candidate division Zixibacteria bacterium]|nr:hypothetical protein [candidate division Zixibacteria bacterium]
MKDLEGHIEPSIIDTLAVELERRLKVHWGGRRYVSLREVCAPLSYV